MIKNKKIVIPIVVLSVLILGALTYLFVIRKDSRDASGINYDPPTAEEKKETEENKKNVADRVDMEQSKSQTTKPSSSSTTKKKNVAVVVTFYGQNPDNKNIEVNGYVDGVYEEGGICTLTLTSGTKRVSATRTSLKDAQTTTCGLNEIARSKVTNGKWNAVLSYSSKNAQGSSTPVTIEVK